MTCRTAAVGALVLLLAIASTHANPTSNNVLVLGDSISQGLGVPGGSMECAAVIAAGLNCVVVSGATWSSMTAAQFSTYRSLVIGDQTCCGSISCISAAMSNFAVWSPQVTGVVVTIGTDPVSETLSFICLFFSSIAVCRYIMHDLQIPQSPCLSTMPSHLVRPI